MAQSDLWKSYLLLNFVPVSISFTTLYGFIHQLFNVFVNLKKVKKVYSQTCPMWSPL
jgi:hypothetical protein